MDVLHFLRTDHKAIKNALERVENVSQVNDLQVGLTTAMAAVELHLDLERDFLYPEIAGAFTGVDALVAAGLANGSLIDKRLKQTRKLLSHAESITDELLQLLAGLKHQILSHFEQEERLLLPKLREFVRTEVREDLGQVLLDAQEERSGTTAASGAKSLPHSSLRRA